MRIKIIKRTCACCRMKYEYTYLISCNSTMKPSRKLLHSALHPAFQPYDGVTDFSIIEICKYCGYVNFRIDQPILDTQTDKKIISLMKNKHSSDRRQYFRSYLEGYLEYLKYDEKSKIINKMLDKI